MGEQQKRAQCHTKLKRYLAQVDAHTTVPLTLTVARECMTRVEEVFQKFEKSQDALEATAVDASALSIQTKAGDEVEKTFCDVRGKLRTLIDQLSCTKAPSSSSSTVTEPKIKLPEIPLATFDGKFENWAAFKDLFVGQVASKSTLSGAFKLQYLKKALKGETAQLIDDIPTTDSNYLEAWNILKDRYDNKREIVRSYITKLLHLKPLKTESATDLQALSDNFVKCLRSLATQGCPTDHWDALTVVMLEEKLDPGSRREWAKRYTGTDTAKFEELITFLKGHIRGLQAAGCSSSRQPVAQRGEKQVKVHHAEAQGGGCVICKESHSIMVCKEFLAKPPGERSKMTKDARLCFNCLKPDHIIKNCPSTRECKTCGSRHHTLLHEDRGNQSSTTTPKVTTELSNHVSVDSRGVVMTVMLHVVDKNGVRQPCRAFIDPGATADFISEACTNRLGLSRSAGCVRVTGFGDTKAGSSKGVVSTTLYSRTNSSKSIDVELHCMRKLTGTIPTMKCQTGRWSHLEGLDLADPRWYQPGTIDILLGIRYYHKIMLTQRLMGPHDDAPVAWETIFGWVVAGACPVEDGEPVSSFHVTADPISNQLQKFWEMEEPPKKRILTQEEKACEEHFLQTYRRDESGRFVVAVPFNEAKKRALGKSRDIAYRRLLQVEKRLKKNPHLCEQYVEFMKEYQTLGHMSVVRDCGEVVGKTNYLCHHFVTNESSTTTKLRVVFDGSAPTSTGVSLNETQLVGATLQDDLYDMLLRVRSYAIVLKADMTKMFRQFKLREEDALLHRVLWRESPEQPVVEYQLNTITYGTACALNLSSRCIQQLGYDCASEFPEASKTLLRDTYIDDILSGRATREDAINLFHQLNSAVATAGLELRKWSSNDRQVIEAIPESMRETSQVVFDDNEMIKALGVQWQPLSDEFTFKKVEFDNSLRTTKRSLLSELARVFDPLGLISCVTLRGKLLLQELWRLPIGWDDDVPVSTRERWEEYKADLHHLPDISIPRLITAPGANRLELHAFGDSSESSFGGIVYLRRIFKDGKVEVRFVTSKTRVAPVRQVTLPRLELCAAVLTAELAVHVREVLRLDIDINCWSDSTITLQWIRATPRRWKTYIANRVATIQELTSKDSWQHVPGLENPADLASRGCSVEELRESELWWKGPTWLSAEVVPEFLPPDNPHQDMEERKVPENVSHVQVEEDDILLRFSCLAKLKRITAWYLRFIKWKRIKRTTVGALSALELQTAMLFWIRRTQAKYFTEDLASLKKNGVVNSRSKLKSLFPYIDNNGILRVSGRLRNAGVPEEKCHQIIIPGKCHFSKLLVHHYHHKYLHGGFQLTWSALQAEFWILRGREMVRSSVRSCVRCRRFRAKVAEQLMGDLPSPRVTPSRAFLHTGVDYAGPFILKDVVGRVPKTYKGYMCLFVCLSTKAIHLEAVTALSTEAFIAALRRFVARRGLCSHIYSDCGTNFVGAERELRSFVKAEGHGAVQKELSSRGIMWHFNPPGAPHVGGLWEAGVKSAKHHLRRVMGATPLTFEQFGTVLTQIEAVLNSRPLYPMSADPSDLQPLTPGHFLIGEPLVSVPDSKWLEIPRNRLSQFQRLQQQLQHFWQRWSKEYLNTLQQRNKWRWEQQNVKVGDLMLLVEETPPGTWKMGRIVEVHPGDDGNVRVATVKTATSTFKRVIAKLVPLLSAESDN